MEKVHQVQHPSGNGNTDQQRRSSEKKKDSVVNNKLPDTIKYAPLSMEKKREKRPQKLRI